MTKRDSRRNVEDYIPGQTEVFTSTMKFRFLRNRFTSQWELSESATTREHDTGRFDYRTPFGKASRGGREGVQIAGLERCLWKSFSTEENVMLS
jgi:hypothetical protein